VTLALAFVFALVQAVAPAPEQPAVPATDPAKVAARAADLQKQG